MGRPWTLQGVAFALCWFTSAATKYVRPEAELGPTATKQEITLQSKEAAPVVRSVEIAPGVRRVIPANFASVGVSAEGKAEAFSQKPKVTVDSLNQQMQDQAVRRLAQQAATGEALAAANPEASTNHQDPSAPIPPTGLEKKSEARNPAERLKKTPVPPRGSPTGWKKAWGVFFIVGLLAAWVAYRRVKRARMPLTASPPATKTPLQHKAALLRKTATTGESSTETGTETNTSEEAAQIYARVQKSLEHLKLAGRRNSNHGNGNGNGHGNGNGNGAPVKAEASSSPAKKSPRVNGVNGGHQ